MCRGNNVLYYTIMSCTSCILTAGSDSEWPLDTTLFPLSERGESIMSKKLWNGNRVVGPEQRGEISVGRAVCYTTVI